MYGLFSIGCHAFFYFPINRWRCFLGKCVSYMRHWRRVVPKNVSDEGNWRRVLRKHVSNVPIVSHRRRGFRVSIVVTSEMQNRRHDFFFCLRCALSRVSDMPSWHSECLLVMFVFLMPLIPHSEHTGLNMSFGHVYNRCRPTDCWNLLSHKLAG